MGIQVPTLSPLSKTIQQDFINRDLYTINRTNLKIAIGSDTTLALDIAKETNECIYGYLLQHLSSYLRAIEGTSTTVESGTQLISVIEDILTAGADWLSAVVALTSESCTVVNLESVSESAWPSLAKHKKIPATFNNVIHYINSIGSLDANLAEILASDQVITEHSDFEEDSKEKLAKTILESRETLPSASLRSGLVESLNLSHYLPAEEIGAENGDLFTLLVKRNIIEDNADTYAHLSETDWLTREKFIHDSKKFIEYMTPELVQDDLATLIVSAKVNLKIKTAIIGRASAFIEGCSKRVFLPLAQLAVQEGIQLTIDVIAELANNEVPAGHVVTLLTPHLDKISREQLFQILESLNGDYPKLSSVGRDKPKIPNTPGDRAILETLKRYGIVKTYDASSSPIKVNKKHKEPSETEHYY